MAKDFMVQAIPTLPVKESDVDIPISLDGRQQLMQIRLLTGSGKEPYLTDKSFFKLPGALRVRYFAKDEVICHQNQPGDTAFVILTDDEVRRLFEVRIQQAVAAERAAIDENERLAFLSVEWKESAESTGDDAEMGAKLERFLQLRTDAAQKPVRRARAAQAVLGKLTTEWQAELKKPREPNRVESDVELIVRTRAGKYSTDKEKAEAKKVESARKADALITAAAKAGNRPNALRAAEEKKIEDAREADDAIETAVAERAALDQLLIEWQSYIRSLPEAERNDGAARQFLKDRTDSASIDERTAEPELATLQALLTEWQLIRATRPDDELTVNDADALFERQIQNATPRQADAAAAQISDAERLQNWKRRVEAQRETRTADLDLSAFAARVYIQPTARERKPTLLGRIFSSIRKSSESLPDTIPFDGPLAIDRRTNRSAIAAGRLFGEMSCMNRQPRAATIVAAHDCFAVEFYRVVLEILKRDKAFQKELSDTYLEYLKDRQFLKLDIFAGLAELPDAEKNSTIAGLRSALEIRRYNPETIICDEFDEPEALHIVRLGMVRVMKGVSSLIKPDSGGQPGDLRDLSKAVALLTALNGKPAAEIGNVLAKAVPALAVQWAAAPPTVAIVAKLLNGWIKADPLWIDSKPLPVPDRFDERLTDRATKVWPDTLEKRRLNRLFLERHLKDALVPVRLPPPDAPLHVINYCGRDDVIGEIGLLDGIPHGATCVAHSHPRVLLAETKVKADDDWIETVHLPRQTAKDLLDHHPSVKRILEQKAKQRRDADVARLAFSAAPAAPIAAPRFNDLGLIQGRELMLIDLDRCTRCDECVKACVSSHTDGRSRLFLDGPRIGRFLVPITCRACQDPVCLIGCPVGSIRRGTKDQIVIENWCIGCSTCANNCPYGSIQMHEVGVIPAGAREWSFRTNSSAQEWRNGTAPFGLTPAAQPGMMSYAMSPGESGPCEFRKSFTLDRKLNHQHYEIEIWSLEEAIVNITLNGIQLPEAVASLDRSSEYAYPPRYRRTYRLATNTVPPSDDAEHRVLQLDKPNVLLIRVEPPSKPTPDESHPLTPPDEPQLLRGVFFDARLKPYLESGVSESNVELEQKQVEHRAVVCDLCADLHNQEPACVNACPHDAAMRVNGWTGFPKS